MMSVQSVSGLGAESVPKTEGVFGGLGAESVPKTEGVFGGLGAKSAGNTVGGECLPVLADIISSSLYGRLLAWDWAKEKRAVFYNISLSIFYLFILLLGFMVSTTTTDFWGEQ